MKSVTVTIQHQIDMQALNPARHHRTHSLIESNEQLGTNAALTMINLLKEQFIKLTDIRHQRLIDTGKSPIEASEMIEAEAQALADEIALSNAGKTFCNAVNVGEAIKNALDSRAPYLFYLATIKLEQDEVTQTLACDKNVTNAIEVVWFDNGCGFENLYLKFRPKSTRHAFSYHSFLNGDCKITSDKANDPTQTGGRGTGLAMLAVDRDGKPREVTMHLTSPHLVAYVLKDDQDVASLFSPNFKQSITSYVKKLQTNHQLNFSPKGYRRVVVRKSEPKIEDIKSKPAKHELGVDDLIAVVKDEQLIIYWTKNGNIFNHAYPATAVSSILNQLPVVGDTTQNQNLINEIVSTYGCSRTEIGAMFLLSSPTHRAKKYEYAYSPSFKLSLPKRNVAFVEPAVEEPAEIQILEEPQIEGLTQSAKIQNSEPAEIQILGEKPEITKLNEKQIESTEPLSLSQPVRRRSMSIMFKDSIVREPRESCSSTRANETESRVNVTRRLSL